MNRIIGGDEEFEVHAFANSFPLLEGDEFDELVIDIREHGLHRPITLTADGKTLVDGRNRLRACGKAMRDPVFDRLPAQYTEVMILDFIVSANLARRHLNPGQRDFLALDYEKFYASATEEAEARRKGAAIGNLNSHHDHSEYTRTEADLPQSIEARSELPRAPQSRDLAAKIVGASGRGVQQAKAVQRDRPDLADKVRSGEIAMDAADRQRREWVRSQPKPEPVKPGPVLLTLRTHDGQEVSYPQPISKPAFNETKGDGISWAAYSWNPVTGCLHGCKYCYAREIATSERYQAAYPAGFTPLFHPERLDAPSYTHIPADHIDDPAYRRVFVCSMADLYGRWVPDEWIAKVHASMLQSPEWEYLLLTKFPARYVGLDIPPRAWVGTSVDEQKRVRIAEDAFRKIEGAAVKWLSLEPLREPLEFADLSMFDWVVIGAQTETYQPTGTVSAFSPPFEWVARLAIQAWKAGCKVHLKPNLLGKISPQLPGMCLPDEYPDLRSP